MDTTVLLSIRKDVSVAEETADQLTLLAPFASLSFTTLTLKQVTPALRAGLAALLDGGASQDQLTASVLEADGISGLYRLNFYLRKLFERSLLCHTVSVDGRPLATFSPLADFGQPYRADAVDSTKTYVLSRFACCRREKDGMVLECPLGHAQVQLHTPEAVALVAELARPATCDQLAAQHTELPATAITGIVNLLLNAQALSEVDAEGKSAEEANSTLAQWEFHDLLFHSRSRLGRHNNPFGKTYSFEEKIPPLPPVKPAMSDVIIPLFKPDIQALKENDIPFSRVLEERRSLRNYDDEQPITDVQLGEFLYRTARVKEMYHDEKGGVTFRPYPGGGALQSLEIYPVIDRCANIPSGLYHYDPLNHQLEKVSDRSVHVETMLQMAWHSILETSRPQILLVIASRFQRVQWKYSSIAYSVILKDLGGLYQTMYLVATAMGLAPCALGGGHSDLFAAAANLDYFAETSVGALVLGSRAKGTDMLADHSRPSEH
ncbi:MAG: SagB/ThcOx family dehydrogenase [Chloroflexi bacterium]|jgi:SagB-type dehydrogenase family enzyme|nr:SagB/ThcOx family dehydrogenase [Chloroflexota bacterium]